jgi:Fur family ferric uptake transcriptional regulator
MKGAYRTRQQDELLDYLKQTPGAHYTAAQIREHFAHQEKSIGTATIYRQLERFVEDGTVRKYLLDTGDSACYEYVAQKELCASHFHCKCEKCGRLIHLECDELKQIQSHLLTAHGFAWNSGKTVFYGVCDQCRKQI